MKSFLAVVLLSVLSYGVKAQQNKWFNEIDTTFKFIIFDAPYDESGQIRRRSLIQYEYLGDTIIDAVKYSKLYETIKKSSLSNPFGSSETTTADTTLAGFSRIDNGRLYYRLADHPGLNCLFYFGPEYLVADYNFAVGDSILSPLVEDEYLHVTKIDTIEIGDESRRRFTLDYREFFGGFTTWIEGIGLVTNGGAFGSVCHSFESVVTVDCWSINTSSGNYPDSACFIEWKPNTINEHPLQSEITIAPNPVQETLSIMGCLGCGFQLIDIYGKVVLSGTIANKYEKININFIPIGIYHLRIKAPNDIPLEFKILKN